MSNTYASTTVPGALPHRASEENIHLVSWGAIFGGVVLVLATQILLSLLGAGIGLGTVHVSAGSTPDASSFGLGAGLWWVVSSCVALFGGSYAAAWLAGNEIRFDGMLHGLVTWAIATVLTVYLLSSAMGGIIGGGLSAIGSVASSAGSTIKDAAAPIANSAGLSSDMVQQQAQAYLSPTNTDPASMSPQDAQKAIAGELVTYEQGGTDKEAAKARIIDITAAQMKISREDAAAPIANSAGLSSNMVQQQAQAYLSPTNTDPASMSSQDAQKAIAGELVTYAQGGRDKEAAKARIIDITAAQMKISREEAAKKFDAAQARVQEKMDMARQKAIDAADATASGASKTSFAVFIDLLLGGIAAALGGAFAIQRRTIERARLIPARS